MIIHEVRIPYKYGDEFRLKPLGDIHYGNTYCDKTALKSYLSDCDENTRIVGLGDYIDAIISRDVKRYMKHSDDSTSDAIIDEQVDGLCEILMPYKDLFIGVGDGNHEHTVVKHHGTNPMKRISERLGCKHLGYSWLIKLVFHEDGSRVRTVIIRGHHGWGGGSRTQGADLTKYSKDIAYWDADIFLYGHTHKLQSDKMERLGIAGKKLVAKPKYLFVCGTFLKTLSLTTDATYSEVAGYPPTSIGAPNITIKPENKWLTIESDV